jgi:hypothetical protein
MNKQETREILNEIKDDFIIPLNKNSKGLFSLIFCGHRTYHVYIPSKNHFDLKDKTENLSDNFPYSIPLDALITRTNYKNGPINSYLAQLNIKDNDFNVKLYDETEFRDLNIVLNMIARKHNLDIKIKKEKQFKEHSLDTIIKKGYFEYNLF